jgi:hypothetical protein
MKEHERWMPFLSPAFLPFPTFLFFLFFLMSHQSFQFPPPSCSFSLFLRRGLIVLARLSSKPRLMCLRDYRHLCHCTHLFFLPLLLKAPIGFAYSLRGALAWGSCPLLDHCHCPHLNSLCINHINTRHKSMGKWTQTCPNSWEANGWVIPFFTFFQHTGNRFLDIIPTMNMNNILALQWSTFSNYILIVALMSWKHGQKIQN